MAGQVHVDRAVARRILGGDEAAFRELFDRFFPRLYRFALVRLNGDAETARDVVQQTFCNAIERLDSYRGEAALYTWFCQICRNAIARIAPLAMGISYLRPVRLSVTDKLSPAIVVSSRRMRPSSAE